MRHNRGRHRPVYDQPKTPPPSKDAQEASADDKNVAIVLSRLNSAIEALVANFEANAKQESNHYPIKEKREVKALKWLRWYTIITGLLLIGAGFQAYIAYDTEVVANRAAVISNKIRFITYQDASISNRDWDIFPVIENVGNSPTNNLHFATGMGVCSARPPDEQNISSDFEAITKGPLSPNEIIGPKSEIPGFTLHGSNVNIDCQVAITAWGIVKYKDIFGYNHVTEFCNYVRSIDRIKEYPANSPVSLQAEPCQSHNCADSECGPDWKLMAGTAPPGSPPTFPAAAITPNCPPPRSCDDSNAPPPP